MSTEYLYGIKPEELVDLKYYDALKFKLDSAHKIFRELYIEGKDPDRVFWVDKAVNHTRRLIQERDSEWSPN